VYLLEPARLYAGYFSIDANTAAIVVLLSALMTAALVIQVSKRFGRKWLATSICGGFVLFTVVFVALFDVLLDYPVFAIRSFFELP